VDLPQQPIDGGCADVGEPGTNRWIKLQVIVAFQGW